MKPPNPSNRCNALRESGTGHSETALTLAGSTLTFSAEMICPRNGTEPAWNIHFSALTYSWFSSNHLMDMLSVYLQWRRKYLNVIKYKKDKSIDHVSKKGPVGCYKLSSTHPLPLSEPSVRHCGGPTLWRFASLHQIGAEDINGRGYRFFTVQGRKEPSFFSTKNPAPLGDEEERMRPAANDSWIYLSMASLSGAERE